MPESTPSLPDIQSLLNQLCWQEGVDSDSQFKNNNFLVVAVNNKIRLSNKSLRGLIHSDTGRDALWVKGRANNRALLG